MTCLAETGELVLDAGGSREDKAFSFLGSVLARVGLRLLRLNANDPSEWTVSDGKKFLKRFSDGMKVPPLPGEAPNSRRDTLLEGALGDLRRADGGGGKGGKGKGGKGNTGGGGFGSSYSNNNSSSGKGGYGGRGGGKGGKGYRHNPY